MYIPFAEGEEAELKARVVAALDQDKFRVWLDAQPERKVVGLKAEYGKCPLACYLKEIVLVYLVNVGQNDIIVSKAVNGAYLRVKLPDWASEFICVLDELPRVQNITAQRAKKVLGQTTLGESIYLQH